MNKSDHHQQCPIFDLDDWVLQSHDTDTLCAGFSCTKCIATPEDFGYDPDTSKEVADDELNTEIPF